MSTTTITAPSALSAGSISVMASATLPGGAVITEAVAIGINSNCPPPVLIEQVFGCTNPSAINYNPNATVDDGSCRYSTQPIVYGCTDPTAQNYNPNATVNDGSCVQRERVVYGCTDPTAANYNPNATAYDGSCIYTTLPTQIIYGCTDPTANNYNPSATVNDGSCSYNTGGGGGGGTPIGSTDLVGGTDLAQPMM